MADAAGQVLGGEETMVARWTRPNRCATAGIVVGAIVALALIALGICALAISSGKWPQFAKDILTRLGPQGSKYAAISSICLGVILGGGLMAISSKSMRNSQELTRQVL